MTFTLHLQGMTRYERLEEIAAFVGEDPSGSFGILGRHARMMTFLNFGLARIRYASGETEYLALPGGLLYFAGNELFINCRDFLRGPDYDRMLSSLENEFRVQEEELKGVKDSLKRLEEEVFRRLWKIRKDGAP